MRLVAQHGLDGAARILRALADEIDGLAGSRWLTDDLQFAAVHNLQQTCLNSRRRKGRESRRQ
jgi:hypothetical protein